MRTLLVAVLVLLSSPLMAQNPANEEEPTPPAEELKGLNFQFKERPSIRYGNVFRLDVKSKWHLDFRDFSPAIQTEEDTGAFTLTRARFGVKGSVTRFFEYEAEREMRGTLGDAHPHHPWKDVYVDFRPYDSVRLKVGKFKMPFGLEQNTSVDRLDFLTRSRVSDLLTPARERGALLHGKFLKGKRIEYEAGVFRFDGENTGIQGLPTAGRTYVARISGEPLRYVHFLPKTIRHTYLGVSATSGEMYEGANAIRGQTSSDLTYFDHVFVKGDRRRTGVELAWTEGPFSIKSEYIRVSEQRKQQGIRVNDLPDKISRGWYVTGSWVALGSMKSKGAEPKDPLLTGKGYGAVELAARLDVISFFSATRTGLESPSPRAANLLPNTDRRWTFGASWYLNHFVKIQANGEREFISDTNRRDFQKQSVDGKNAFWTATVRLQFAM